jgi:hypothetical protein
VRLPFDPNQGIHLTAVAAVVGHDQLKANALQIFKTKGVTSFKTV